MKKILVPTDFSEASRNAEEYAVSLSKVLGAKVHLLHVYRELMVATEGPEPWPTTVTELQVQNEKLMNIETDYLKTRYGVDVESILKIGSKGKSITNVATEIKADVVVMAIRTVGRNRIFGNTVLSTLRRSNLPVLIIPQGAKFNSIRNIVLAVDFDEMVLSKCFDPLYDIYKEVKPAMRVLHVDERAEDLKESEVPDKLQLGHVLSRFDYVYDRIESYEVGKGIMTFLENHPTDMLVMVAHHHSLYERLFEPVYTKTLSLQLNIPVLILKQNE